MPSRKLKKLSSFQNVSSRVENQMLDLLWAAAKNNSFLSGPAFSPPSLGLMTKGTFFLTLKKRSCFSGTPVFLRLPSVRPKNDDIHLTNNFWRILIENPNIYNFWGLPDFLGGGGNALFWCKHAYLMGPLHNHIYIRVSLYIFRTRNILLFDIFYQISDSIFNVQIITRTNRP